MAGTKILVDTGPLVGFLNQADQYHRWSVDTWRRLYEPMWTCEAVLSEAIFLVQSEGLPIDSVLALFERGLVVLDFDLSRHRPDVWALLRKYADQPISLADACLVRMSELHAKCQVFTTDRHFRVYRRKGRGLIPLLTPF
jgi:uncharacterized protein